MPWRQQGGRGGGPWGSGPSGPGGGGFGGRGPGSPQGPDFEEMLRQGQERIRRMIPGGFGSGRGVLLLVLLGIALWLASGFYRVEPSEQGVVLRFGEWVRSTGPGLHYHLPAPIESVETPNVTRVNRVEVGMRSGDGGRAGPIRDIPEESLMLTGDQNIVNIDLTVFWVIKDAGMYLFNIRNPEATVKLAAESAIRDVIAQTPIQAAFTEGRQEIEQATSERLQKLLDAYGAGIEVRNVQLLTVDPPQPVIDAFIDVQRARQDQERAINEAEAYARDIIPRARGDAERDVQAARAYREEVVNRSEGDAQRFLKIFSSYENAKDVTTDRIYLETMEEVLRGMNKVIIDPSQGSSGVVPYLPLPELRARGGGAAQPNQQQPNGGRGQ